jgi:transcriptional regulator with XRE-family HTH domain
MILFLVPGTKVIGAVSQKNVQEALEEEALPAVSFGKRLTSLRKARGLTSLEVGSAVGVSRVCVWKWETGHMYPSSHNLQGLADTLQISISQLVCGYEAHLEEASPLSFGERLVQIRRACRLSPDELARKTHVTRMCIWKWENGRSHPRPPQLKRLADALSTSVSMLTHGDHDNVAIPDSENLLLRRQFDHAKRSGS